MHQLVFYERQIKPINENYLLNERLALIRKRKNRHSKFNYY